MLLLLSMRSILSLVRNAIRTHATGNLGCSDIAAAVPAEVEAVRRNWLHSAPTVVFIAILLCLETLRGLRISAIYIVLFMCLFHVGPSNYFRCRNFVSRHSGV